LLVLSLCHSHESGNLIFFLEKEGFYKAFVVVQKGRLYIQRTADNFIANDNFLVIIISKSNLIKKERQRNETY